MPRRRAIEFLSALVLVVTLLATIGPAAQAVGDGIGTLWPVGVVGVLIALCLAQAVLHWRRSQPAMGKAQDRVPVQGPPAPRPGQAKSVARPSTARLEHDPAKVNAALGRRIRELRHRRGLTQEELAYEAGMHPVALGRLERGVQGPRLATIIRVAHGLDIEPSELLRGGHEQGAVSG